MKAWPPHMPCLCPVRKTHVACYTGIACFVGYIFTDNKLQKMIKNINLLRHWSVYKCFTECLRTKNYNICFFILIVCSSDVTISTGDEEIHQDEQCNEDEDNPTQELSWYHPTDLSLTEYADDMQENLK